MGNNELLNMKFTTQLMCQICLYDWDWVLGRDYSCYVSKMIGDKKVYIIYDPYSDKFKHSFVINSKEYQYPKTIREFVGNCKKEDIDIILKDTNVQ